MYKQGQWHRFNITVSIREAVGFKSGNNRVSYISFSVVVKSDYQIYIGETK